VRVANVRGRLTLVVGEGAGIDVASASGGRFPAAPQEAYGRWAELAVWAAGADHADATPFTPDDLGPPVPAPRQVFGVGLNYRAHAGEAGRKVPDAPLVFTMFPSCVTGPRAEVAIPDAESHVDWEVELVVVIGREARRVPPAEAWAHVAGLTVGQDVSERRLQRAGELPQFSLAKSHPGFGPIGPVVVTPDEVADPDDVELRCVLNGEEVQHGRSGDLIFPVRELVAYLSSIVTLWPGDLIFTGTPPGVGLGRTPPRYLSPGDELVSSITGIGEIRQRFISYQL
jgi:2,4-diketo-3-deoxy-L-fuconate hydrolase